MDPFTAVLGLIVLTAAGIGIVAHARELASKPERPPPPAPQTKPPSRRAPIDPVLVKLAAHFGLEARATRARGNVDQIALTLELSASGDAETLMCRATFPRPLGLEIQIETGVTVSDGVVVSPGFDLALRVDALHVDQARLLLTGEIGDALLAFALERCQPRMDDADVELVLPVHAGYAALKRRIEQLLLLANNVVKARARLPRPALESRVLAAYAELANTYGGVVDPTRVALELRRDHGEIELLVERAEQKRYRSRIQLVFARALAGEISVRHASTRSLLERLKSDIVLGDSAFDSGFVVQGDHDLARQTLGPPVRAALSTLAERVEALELDQHRILLELRGPVTDLVHLGAIIEALDEIGGAVMPRSSSRPYR